MSEIKSDKLSPRTDNGTTVFGDSGDTFSIPAGVTITNSGTATGFGMFSSYAIICDQKSSGTVSGTFTSGSYQTRDLNTEITDPDGIVSIASNEFTLGAGSYLIEWSAPAVWVTAHKSRLYDVTGTAEVQLGAPEYSHSTSPTSNVSLGSARVSPSGSNAYRIEHRCATTRSVNCLG